MKKEINISHLVVTVGMMVSCFWFFGDLDSRIKLNSRDIENMQAQRKEDKARIEKQLDNINRKLDKLLEGKR